MRVIYRKIRHARHLYIKRNVEKVWGARYLSKNTLFRLYADKLKVTDDISRRLKRVGVRQNIAHVRKFPRLTV